MKNYFIIGDIHSQYSQLAAAIDNIDNSCDDYHIIFLGDIFDSRTEESNSVDVYYAIKSLYEKNLCTVIQSNHQDKFIRYLKGNSVAINHGLDRTIEDFNNSTVDKAELLEWLLSFPYGVAFKDNLGLEYRCAHAYFSSKIFVPNEYEDEYLVHLASKHTKSKFIYGLTVNNSRFFWWEEPSQLPWIRVAGHYHKLRIDYEYSKSLVLDAECGSDGGLLCVYDVNNRQNYLF